MEQGRARVHELAAEFGVTTKDVLVLLGGWNEFVKSASSTVEAPLARRVREHYAVRQPRPISSRDYGASAGSGRPVSKDNGFGAALEKARRQSRRTSPGSHKPGEIEIALFRCVIDPLRTRRGGTRPRSGTGWSAYCGGGWRPGWTIWLSGSKSVEASIQTSRRSCTRRGSPLLTLTCASDSDGSTYPQHDHSTSHPGHARDQRRGEPGQGVSPLAVGDRH